MGIGPTQPAWKAGALPLSYTRTFISNFCKTHYNNIIYWYRCQQFFLNFLFLFLVYKKIGHTSNLLFDNYFHGWWNSLESLPLFFFSSLIYSNLSLFCLLSIEINSLCSSGVIFMAEVGVPYLSTESLCSR